LGVNIIQIVIDIDIVSIQIHFIKIVNIKNVLHVFSLAKNLLLMCQLTQNGSSIEFHHTFCSIKPFTLRGKPVHLQCLQVDSLYPISIRFNATPPITSDINLFSMVDRINPNLKTYILQHFVHGLCAMTKQHQILSYIVKMFNFIWFEPKKPQAGYGQTYEHTYCISQLSIQRKLMTIKLLKGHLITKCFEDFQGVLDEASSSSLTINYKKLIILLLIALPPSFHPFISTHGHDPTFTFVVITRTSARKGIKFAT
jgi:hypothetical protein